MKISFPARTIEIGTPSLLEASFGPPLGQLQPIEFLYGRPRRNFERIGHEIDAFDDIGAVNAFRRKRNENGPSWGQIGSRFSGGIERVRLHRAVFSPIVHQPGVLDEQVLLYTGRLDFVANATRQRRLNHVT